MAAFAIRPRAANSGAACPLVLSGVRRTAKFVFTLMKPSAPPSTRSLPISPRPARPGACGCGSARRGSNFRCTKAARSDGSRRATPPSTTCSPTVYAGAYVYGRTRHEIVLDAAGGRKKRVRHLPRAEWQVLIPEHHAGFIDWQTYDANQQRIARNTRPGPHQAGGAVREGGALLQGLARCGHCGRRLHTHYRGRNASPGYHCAGKVLVENRGVYCLNIGGIQINEAVTRTFVAALEPAGLAATLAAAERLEVEREAALKQWRLGVERANYEAQRAERRYRAVDPDNRLVARGLERDWEERLRAVETAEIELERREKERPRAISPPSGTHQRPRRATGRSCYAPSSKRSRSRSIATRRPPISRCAGRAAHSTRSSSLCRARGRPPSAPTRTRSRCYAGSRPITPMV